MRRFNLQTESKVDTERLSLTNLVLPQKNRFVFDPSAALQPASVSLHDLFPPGNAPVSVQTNTGASSSAPPLPTPTPPQQAVVGRVIFAIASSVVLVGLLIMCQVSAANGSLLPSLLSAKHK